MYIQMLDLIKHSPVRNYIVPGLTSWMINDAGELGKIRLFQCERDHQESIVPHSHRYDFSCAVLKGHVYNIIWKETLSNEDGDLFTESVLTYQNEIGKFNVINSSLKRYKYESAIYREGDWYHMRHNEIHSIEFSKGAKVLFIESAIKCETSIMLEPNVNGQTIPTGEVKDWMFLKG